MTELLTAAQMRAIEQAAIASGAVTGLELMERAGRGVVEAILNEWPEFREGSHRAVILCGPGNNGGDGFVVARLLKAAGWAVEVFLYGNAEKLPPDARVNYERWREVGEVRSLSACPHPAEVHADLYLDALFGTGLTRQPSEKAAEALVRLRLAVWPYERSLRQQERFVAVDVPSGLCADSGCVLDGPSSGLAHFRADLTVTFHSAKAGHFLADGPELTGRFVVADIGLASQAARTKGQKVRLTERGAAAIREGTHKYTHGHALILSGPATRTGAARLAARGALRIGAGLVTVACPPDAAPEHAARLDAIMLRPVPDAPALATLLEDRRINAICIGPGLGLDAHAAALVAVVLAAPEPGLRTDEAPPRHVVLDADALTLLARDPALMAQLHENCALTPHAGEFARLFPDIAERLDATPTTGPAYSKVDATRDAAARAGCTVLLKGPDTVIADPSGRCSINSAHYERSAPWLATAGSGDVLAGFIAGLLARGFSPHDAAATAAWLHVECALSFGPGLIAEDLPEELPKVFRALKV